MLLPELPAVTVFRDLFPQLALSLARESEKQVRVIKNSRPQSGSV
jgi:hypothetical protein